MSSRDLQPQVMRQAVPALAGNASSSSGMDADGDSFELSLRDGWQLLVRRRWQVLAVAAVVLAVTVVYTLLDTPLYRATVVLQVDAAPIRVVKSESLEVADARDDYMVTQLELVKSRNIAEHAVRRLGLVGDRQFEAASERTSGFGALLAFFRGTKAPSLEEKTLALREERVVERILKDLEVRRVGKSRLVELRYVSSDPKLAVRVANGIAQAYMQGNLDRRIDNTQFARTFLEDRLQQIKQKLQDSELALIRYAQEQKIANIDQYASLAAKNLSDLTSSLAAAQSERMKAQSRQGQAADLEGMSTEQMKSPVLESLRQKLVELKSEYESKLSVFKPDYPEMLQLSNRIGELEQQIASEKRTYSRAFAAQYKAASINEALLNEQIDKLRTEMLDLQGRTLQYSILKREADTNRELYDGLLQRYKEIGVAGDVAANNISIIDGASRAQRFKPVLVLNLAVGLLGGLCLGVLVAFGLERLDDTVKSPEDIERQLALPVIGIIPKIASDDYEAMVANPRSSISEAYRSLRTALQYSANGGTPKVLMVTSSAASEGKTTTSAMLARQFASLGQTVLVVDADLRKPSLHTHFNLPNESGLGEYLRFSSEVEEVSHLVEPNLTVITAGSHQDNPVELLAQPRFRALLQEAAATVDQIIIDCPPLLGLADAPTIAGSADGVLLVVEAARSRAGVLQATTRRLTATGAPVQGVVLVKFDAKSAGYGSSYAYAYQDYYYDGYGRRDDASSSSPRLRA